MYFDCFAIAEYQRLILDVTEKHGDIVETLIEVFNSPIVELMSAVIQLIKQNLRKGNC